MNTTIIVALLATLTAIVTAIITNFLSKSSTLKFEERKLKEQYYLEFIHALSENMNSGNDEAIIRYNHAYNSLTIIANSTVLYSLYEFSNLIIRQLKYGDISDYEAKYTEAFTRLIKEMRTDLYGGRLISINKGLPEINLLSGVLRSDPKE